MDISGFDDTIDWYDANADAYASATAAAIPIKAIEKFLTYLPAKPAVLEAGCGAGWESTVFVERGANVTGVDISEGLLDVARKRNPAVEYHRANFLELPFPYASFDGVWSHASLVHLEKIEDVEEALREFFRVLKSGGYLYVYVKAQAGKEKTAVVADSLSKHERFFRYFTSEELSGLLTEAGFEISTSETEDDPHGRTEVRWLEIIAQKRA